LAWFFQRPARYDAIDAKPLTETETPALNPFSTS
jgi:hypothetical protein